MALETHEHNDIFDRGLAFDLSTMFERRRALKLLGGAALMTLVGCGSSKVTGSAATTSAAGAATTAGSATTAAGTATTAGTAATTAATAATTAASTATTAAAARTTTCEVIPQETAGPYPGDGSNGANALNKSGIVRSDIRSSFGTSTTAVPGVVLSVKLQVLQSTKSCAPLAGAAVYIWHCSPIGNYSMYSNGATNENYLRGVQEADANGFVTFTTIFPGAYPGRWPHIHFEVFPTLANALASGSKLTTSQLALPEAVCKTVYATSGYRSSLTNLAATPLSRDMVFSDGVTLQTPNVTGDVTAGYAAQMTVGV
jgi:protocatechuate 3,4-dioxygenase beta subunit